jgi:NAD(P)-dependent dehydrogenase (short-subunit alcohol dehydrogenase family)
VVHALGDKKVKLTMNLGRRRRLGNSQTDDRRVLMLLKNKIAIIYGAGGAVGGAVARAFAREGAKLFLTGRRRASVEAVAREVISAGGAADVAEVDALDERDIDRHLQAVTDKADRLDISFNAVGLRNTKLQGVPLVELDVEEFARPIATYTRSYLLTARQAARRMVAKGSGVIMAATSTPSRAGIPLMGGVGPAMSAVEQLTRNLSAELAPKGIRVVGLRPTGMPDSGTIKEVFDLHAKAWGITWDQFQELIASRSHGRRLTTLAEMANMAAFMASDQASGMTGTTVNLSLGALDD